MTDKYTPLQKCGFIQNPSKYSPQTLIFWRKRAAANIIVLSCGNRYIFYKAKHKYGTIFVIPNVYLSNILHCADNRQPKLRPHHYFQSQNLEHSFCFLYQRSSYNYFCDPKFWRIRCWFATCERYKLGKLKFSSLKEILNLSIQLAWNGFQQPLLCGFIIRSRCENYSTRIIVIIDLSLINEGRPCVSFDRLSLVV